MEIEVKLKVASHDAVRATLRACGATYVGRVLETNSILDLPDASLAKRGAALRVRGITGLDGAAASSTMTFKGPIQPAKFKTREEIEVPIRDADGAVRILTSAGLNVVLQFEKRRESWKVGECLVELDELPILGSFVEIEGPTESAIDLTLRSLNLQDASPADKTYVAMLVAHCETHGPADRVVHLPNHGIDR